MAKMMLPVKRSGILQTLFLHYFFMQGHGT